MTNKDEIAQLKHELAELKTAITPASAGDAQAAAVWRDEMRAVAERRASSAISPEVVRDWAAVPDHIVRGIVRDCRAPTGPSSAGAVPSSQQVTNVRPAGGSGWQAPIPLSSPPGVAQADRLMDEQDRRDRAERVVQHAQMQAMQKLAEPKP